MKETPLPFTLASENCEYVYVPKSNLRYRGDLRTRAYCGGSCAASCVQFIQEYPVNKYGIRVIPHDVMCPYARVPHVCDGKQERYSTHENLTDGTRFIHKMPMAYYIDEGHWGR